MSICAMGKNCPLEYVEDLWMDTVEEIFGFQLFRQNHAYGIIKCESSCSFYVCGYAPVASILSCCLHFLFFLILKISCIKKIKNCIKN